MWHPLERILLWLFVINLGIAFGAGLYESRVVVPNWLAPGWDAEAARAADTGVRFWVYVTTVPLTLLTVANLVLAWRAHGLVRKWWLVSTGMTVLERVFTFAFFIPTMLWLTGDDVSRNAAEVAARWATLNSLRHAMVFVAWFAALMVLSFSGRDRLESARTDVPS